MKNAILICGLCISTTLFAIDSKDESSIKGIVEHYVNAWNQHAGKGFGDHFSQDADFVNIFGMVFSGKEEIELRHIEILQTFLKDSNFEVTNFKLREINPNVMIGLVSWTVDGFHKPGADSSKETMKGVFSHTFVKNGEHWEIVSTQNTLAK